MSLRIQPDFIDLIGRMLQKNPKKRPSCAEILAHPIFVVLEKHNSDTSDSDDKFKSKLESVKKQLKLSPIERNILG